MTRFYLQSDVLLLTCVFDKIIKVSSDEFSINLPVYVSLPGYTWQCGLKNTGINLQTLQEKDMIPVLEKTIRGGISSILGDRYVKSDENKKILYIDSNNLIGWTKNESLPYDAIEMWHIHPDLFMDKLEELINTSDDLDICYFRWS